MGRHINACFTHPITKEMIMKTNGDLSGDTNTIVFGLVTDIDDDEVTYIDPSNSCKQPRIIKIFRKSLRNTPSVGWLCLFVIYHSCSYYHLPIVDLSQHTKFMETYNPDDLPPAESFAYNALIDKWNNEECKKELSNLMPEPNELNLCRYLEAWCDSINAYNYEDHKQKLKERRKEMKKEN
eukprot:UN01297